MNTNKDEVLRLAKEAGGVVCKHITFAGDEGIAFTVDEFAALLTSKQAQQEPKLTDFHNGDAAMWIEDGKVRAAWNEPFVSVKPVSGAVDERIVSELMDLAHDYANSFASATDSYQADAEANPDAKRNALEKRLRAALQPAQTAPLTDEQRGLIDEVTNILDPIAGAKHILAIKALLASQPVAASDERILQLAEEMFGRSREYSNCFGDPSERGVIAFVRALLSHPAAPAQPAPAVSQRDVMRTALEKINTIRNSIIGLQKMDWSEHIYPLVAALDEAGFEGMEYPEAREYFGTLLERAVKAEDAIAALSAPAAQQPQSNTSIDDMCAILKQHRIEADEYTDCAIVYRVTFDQLRSLYDQGRISAPAAQQPWQNLAMASVPHPDDETKRVVGFVVPNMGADMPSVQLAQILGGQQPSELERLRETARLIGSIFVHGGFKAETYNECELERLLREQGEFYETIADFEAKRPSMQQPSETAIHYPSINVPLPADLIADLRGAISAALFMKSRKGDKAGVERWRTVGARLDSLLRPAAQEAEKLPAKLVVSTGANTNSMAVLVSVHRGDYTTVVYSKNHSLSGDTVGVAEIPGNLLAHEAEKPRKCTDLSIRLREEADVHPGWRLVLTAAADEIERYYGGMLAWKQAAEKKDRDWSNERMGRMSDRIAAREQPAKGEK